MMEETHEEIVYYRIYPDYDANVVDPKKELRKLQTECLTIAYPAAGEYIWQHETFNLRICANSGDYPAISRKGSALLAEIEDDIAGADFASEGSFVPHLFGKVKYGDNLEDEWLVVYLLFEISRRIPRLSITVRDTDGEFLLIEAAYSIPRWLKPENSHNRVFIRQGFVHLVPSALSTPRSQRSEKKISLVDSLKVLSDGKVETRASDKFNDTIFHRMKGYPEKALKNMNRARCRVPLPVAHILRHEPQLISMAVESFYNRDLDAMKAASRMEKFLSKGEDGTVEMVDVVVRMSRAMYAQLVQQRFQAPRCYPMPSSNSSSSTIKEAELGMKIACGFEIMYSERSSYVSEENPGEDEPSPDNPLKDNMLHKKFGKQDEFAPTNDARWQAYRASLEKNGYFKGLLEGSKGYRELLQAAVVQYRATGNFASVSAAMRAPVKRTDELLSLPHSAKEFADAGSEESDSDSWLYDGEKDLRTVMMEREKEMNDYVAKLERGKAETKADEKRSNEEESTEMFQTAEVVRSMHSFVNKMSSFEGAELPGNKGTDVLGDDSVSLDMRKLMKELGSVFSPEEIANMLNMKGSPDDSDISADTDMDEDEDEDDDTDTYHEAEDDVEGEIAISTSKAFLVEEEDEVHAGGSQKQEDAIFSDAYYNVMDKELQSSSLAKSFLQKKEVEEISKRKEIFASGNAPKVSRKAGLDPDDKSAEVPEPDDKELESEDGDEDNDLVDVDVNLVESLLRSFTYQQGMPGPATNLLGAMGVDLPDNADKRPGSSQKAQ